MNTEEMYLLWVGFRHYIGFVNNKAWRDFKREWRKRYNWPTRCMDCHKRVKSSADPSVTRGHDLLTLDHVIPRSLLYELGLYELIYDFDNFRLLCQSCNTAKGNSVLTSSDVSHALLTKYYAAIDRRNKELALLKH